ncbi:MAG: histidine kinase N-terminal 7TM domain-containing protein [Candidatus Margulisiibacteriota bacterium]
MLALKLNIFSLCLILSAMITLALSVYAIRRKGTPGASVFSLMMLAVTVYSFGYALELASTTYEGMSFWVKIEYLGIPFLTVSLFLFLLSYGGMDKKINPFLLVLLLIVPFASMIANMTNDLHHLFYTSAKVNYSGPFPLQILIRGPLYYVNVAYSYLMLIMGFMLWFRLWKNASAYRRSQLSVILAAILVPCVSNILYLFGITVYNFDLTAFAFTTTGIILTLGLFRYKLLDLSPIARELLIEEINQGMIVVDEWGRIVDLNPLGKQWLGLKNKSFFGKTIYELKDPWKKMIKMNNNELEEIFINDPELARFPIYVEIKKIPLHDSQNKQIGSLFMLQDVSQRKLLENELRVQNKMILQFIGQNFYRIKDDFSPVMFQELRTPVTAMRDSLSQILEESYGKINDNQKRLIEIARRNSERIYRLLSSILDFYKLKAGKSEMKLVRSDIRKVLQDVYGAFKILTQSNTISLILNVPEAPLEADFDNDFIRQVVLNLVFNAFKFTEKGEIEMLASKEGDGSILICVADTGPGVSPEEIDGIFSKFKRPSEKDHGRIGEGFGLAICKEIIELHGGRIWVESTPGVGSKFCFTLPPEKK